jgi:hypothetical protein
MLNWTLQTQLIDADSVALRNVVGAATDHGTTIVAYFNVDTGLDVFRATDGGLNGAGSWTNVITFGSWGGGTSIVLYVGSNTWIITGGPGGYFYTSTDDGQTWALTTPSGASILKPIAGATDGNGTALWALESNTGIEGITNGLTADIAIYSGGTPGGADGNTNAFLWDGTQFVFVSLNSSTYGVFTAPTGFLESAGPTWTNQGSGTANQLGSSLSSGQGLAYASALGYMCPVQSAGGSPAYSQVVLSPTPAGLVTATPIVTPTDVGLVGVYALGSKLFLTGGGANAAPVYETSDGATWVQDTPNFTNGANEFLGWALYDSVNNTYIMFSNGTPGGSVCTAPAPTVPQALVPSLIGDTGVAATATLLAAGLAVGTVLSQYNPNVSAGIVFTQTIPPATSVAFGTAIGFTLSLGPPLVSVPDVVGETVTETEATLVAAGLAVGSVTAEYDPAVPPGTVILTLPPTGSAVASGSSVALVIAADVPPFNVDATVISQYQNSPTLTQLVANMNEYLDPTANLLQFYDYVWNVNTAQGFGLDIWGRIVGVSRVLQIPGENPYFGFKNPNSPPDWQNFGNNANSPSLSGAPFKSAGNVDTGSYTLNDSAFRTLILAKALANISATTAPALNRLVQNLFPGAGVAYTQDGGQSNTAVGGMSMTYVFEFSLTIIEYAILANSGVLPHPAGVAVSITSS